MSALTQADRVRERNDSHPINRSAAGEAIAAELITGRERLGISQEELARLSGVSLATIRWYERGGIDNASHTKTAARIGYLRDVLGESTETAPLVEAERLPMPLVERLSMGNLADLLYQAGAEMDRRVNGGER